MRGKISYYNKDRKYGYIEVGEDERDIYFNRRNIKGGFENELTDGIEVDFDVINVKNAINLVKVLDQ